MRILKVAQQTFDEEIEEWIDKWVDDGGEIESGINNEGERYWDAHTPDGRSTYTSLTPDDLLNDLKSYYKMQGFISGILD
jgi:hypothetical protein